MGTDVQVCLIGFVNGVAMLALEVWAGLLEGLHKNLLKLGQPLAPTRDALQPPTHTIMSTLLLIVMGI